MSTENEYKPDLAKYYPVSKKAEFEGPPEFTLKNISIALLLLGLIAFMVNALMVFLYMTQEWVMIWPAISMAKVGAILMCVGGGLYFVNFLFPL